MKIVLPGGSGQIGTLLARALHADGHDVVVISRHPAAAAWRTMKWDAMTMDKWAGEINGADVVINLAGRSVNCRYTADHRREITESRIRTTRLVGRAIAEAKQPPRAWLQASTATIYAHSFDQAQDEVSGVIGGSEPGVPETWRFSIEVATSWERAAREANVNPAATRLVLMRSAMTMSPDRGGIFDTLVGLVRRGLGGPAGDGRQYVSWIHETDFVRAVRWLMENEAFSGVVNLASPHPLPNVDFMRGLREAAGQRAGLSASRWMLELGAVFMRTETELVLKSRRVVPRLLLLHDFKFEHPDWPAAAHELFRRWRK